MNIVVSILLAILAFGFLIFTHELGHFLAARAFGVTVKEFCIGFGPKLLWYTSKKTGIKYALAALPFGGYVSREGEDAESEDPNALHKKAAWKRLIIMAAGGVVNLITGFLLIIVLVCNMPLGSTVVAEHPEELKGNYSTAEVLLKGDRILSVAGQRVHISDDLFYQIMRYGCEPVEVEVQRGGKTITLTVQFPTRETDGQVIGDTDFRVYAEPDRSFGTVVKHAFYRSVNTVEIVWESIIDLIRGRYSFEAVSGPIGITETIGTAVGQEGASFGQRALMFCNLFAMISVNLGVVNLMPLPALDGGRILCLLIEVIIRRPLPQKVEGMIHGIGIAVLFLLMIVIAVKDIFAIFV